MYTPVKTQEQLQKEWRNQYVQWYAAGMPTFQAKKKDVFKQIAVKFKSEEDRNHFSDKMEYNLTKKTNVVYYPARGREENMTNRYVETDTDHFNPKYPIYIISKGRADTRHTAKTLEKMGIPYYIAVEPQEYDVYVKATSAAGDLGTVLELPFSNHGKGSGPARNWCWEHSQANGHARHWLMDDNIDGFVRLHKNKRYRVENGSGIFRATEDFVDRYENVALASFQYKFFVVDPCPYQPFILNTRMMSCILIDNNCPHKWRGKFNEDVDLSIRVLKEGLCTVLMYAFVQGKLRTGTVKGGNTTEVYEDYSGEGENDPAYNKSKMLKEMHPDCVTLVERYGRVHHHVDLNAIMTKDGYPARQNPLILKKDMPIVNKVDNYGMQLMRNWNTDEQYPDPQFEADEFPEGRTSIHG
jgi:hypothetical protein|tara:strand:+ start:335 stop:1570 length:1236 start_codon:yes stop_codon:yes gene_type:complete